MNQSRSRTAKDTLTNVQTRSKDLQKILRQMEEVSTLFTEMAAIVAEQDPAVENIEAQAEETHKHVGDGVVQLNDAEKKARAARKKKWICLGITSTSHFVSCLLCYEL